MEDSHSTPMSVDKSDAESYPVEKPGNGKVSPADQSAAASAATTVGAKRDKPEDSEHPAAKKARTEAMDTTANGDNDNNNNDKTKNAYDDLRWTVVRNDGQDASMIKLIGLKSLFAAQLPKMPRPYIARLVLNRNHTSLAILNDQDESVRDTDKEIIGGICYRAFPEMRFAEIAFCAVNATHQVKGYGTKLMNLLKQVAVQTGIEYLITYADNYAIGYFKKQGFSKAISMPKGRYTGLIKEYDGGTPMECYIHPSVDYCRLKEIIAYQRNYILRKIAERSKSHIVYPPLDPEKKIEHAMQIPGLQQAGWTAADVYAVADTGNGELSSRDLLSALRRIDEQQFAWPFREPVDPQEVPDYRLVIKEPIDLCTMEKRVRADYYRNKEMFFRDLKLMVENCKAYNEEASTYVQCAKKLDKFVNDKLR